MFVKCVFSSVCLSVRACSVIKRLHTNELTGLLANQLQEPRFLRLVFTFRESFKNHLNREAIFNIRKLSPVTQLRQLATRRRCWRSSSTREKWSTSREPTEDSNDKLVGST